jgi:hypothetical protein
MYGAMHDLALAAPPSNRAVLYRHFYWPLSAPIVIRLIVISNFLPEQLSFFIAGMRLTLTRVILIAVTPLLVMRLGAKVAAGRYRFVLSDLFVPVAGVWMVLALAETDDLPSALSHGGPIALEFCVGYMATRVLLSQHGHALSFANLLCGVLTVVALLGPLDLLTGQFVTRGLASSLTGYPVPFADNLFRFGLLRATGPLEHSILFGIACASGLLVAVAVPVRCRVFVVVACALGAMASICSAAIQGIFIGLALLAYNRILARVRLRWFFLITVMAAGFGLIFIVIGEPFRFIFNHLILDVESGYYRLYTWQKAGEFLGQSPWFGIGFATPDADDIPASVDSVWLWSALRFGVPGSVLIGLSIIGAASLSTSGARVRLTPAETSLGRILGVLIFLLVFWGFTVDFWGSDWVLIALLAGVRAHLGELGRLGRA